MKKLMILCLFAIGANVHAEKLNWHEGSIVLTNEKVVEGEISLDPAHDHILLRKDGSITIYTASKIKSFLFYDVEKNANHKFISLKDHQTTKTQNHFYEVVLRGKASILCQPKPGYEQETSRNFDHNFNYYVSLNNQLIDLNKFRKQVFPIILQSHADQVTAFMYQNHLNPNFQDSDIKIIEFYNRLENSNTFANNP